MIQSGLAIRMLLLSEAAALIGLGLPGAVSGQVDLTGGGTNVAWQYTWDVPPGLIRGAVFDSDGEPLSSVQVSTGMSEVTFTDDEGHFEISSVPLGPVQVLFELIGYHQVRQSLFVPTDLGISMVVLLPESVGVGGGPCGDTSAADGLHVTVLDSVTGLIPQVPLTIRLERDGLFWERTDTLRTALYGSPALFLPHRVEVPGLYNLVVTAPGYHSWRLNGVELDVDWTVCGPVPDDRYYIVRLVPIGEQLRLGTADPRVSTWEFDADRAPR